MSFSSAPENGVVFPSAFRSRLLELPGCNACRILLMHVTSQKLSLFENNEATAMYPAATSRFGIGNREGSFMTPPGIHRIADKIGADAPPGQIFRDRIDTGEKWRSGEDVDNLILTRIIRLQGCEDGVNRGPGIDSFDRYIYIHGTNKESAVGIVPISRGCICLKNSDIILLFDKVEVGDIVIIN
jgi:UDP-N-acetylmuramate--alanine ligase